VVSSGPAFWGRRPLAVIGSDPQRVLAYATERRRRGEPVAIFYGSLKKQHSKAKRGGHPILNLDRPPGLNDGDWLPEVFA
jgi:hypothetical protein